VLTTWRTGDPERHESGRDVFALDELTGRWRYIGTMGTPEHAQRTVRAVNAEARPAGVPADAYDPSASARGVWARWVDSWRGGP